MSDIVISKYGDPNQPPWEWCARVKGDMNKEIMSNNLLEIKEVLDVNDIKFAFIFGTLLGIIRGDGLISYDHDADIMCFSKDHRNFHKVIDVLTERGFYVPDKNKCSIGDHFFIRGGEKLDVWWFIRIGNEWVYDNEIRYPAIYFDQLEEVDFLGTKWKVPHDPKAFLELTYGSTWVTPNPKGAYILGR